MNGEINIGARIKSIRLEKGILLKDLANKCKISSSMLSQIEKGNANPSLNTIKAIAQVLEIPIFKFFLEPELNEYTINILKKQDRKIILTNEVTYELISPEGSKQIECMKMILNKKNSESSAKPSAHKGEEIAVVVKGKVKVTIGDENCEMEKGDSIQIPSLIPHKWTNLHDEESIILFSVAPPGF